MGNFISADLTIVESFIQQSSEMVTRFNNLKDRYETINETLLGKWEGHGADAYKYETDHILENIGGIGDILKSINEDVLNSILSSYSQIDEELGEFNQNPPTEAESSPGSIVKAGVGAAASVAAAASMGGVQ